MKTVQEWREKIHESDMVSVRRHWIESIQADAYRAGMLRAAQVVHGSIGAFWGTNPKSTPDGIVTFLMKAIEAEAKGGQ